MEGVLGTFFRHYRQLAVIGSLVFATGVCLGLFVLRMVHTHSFFDWGLIWNLFLAWLPALSALAAYNLRQKGSVIRWIMASGFVLVWLLFLPNAPYLITDIMSLQPQPEIPYWFDLILYVAFAWTGCFLGLVSLLLIQEVVRQAAGALASWLFILGVLALNSFGIYLGRFLRWNSWDVILNPWPLFTEIAQQVRHPLAHFQTVVFSALFTFFFLAAYLMLVAVTRFQGELQTQEPTRPIRAKPARTRQR
jgi:uncharacterized membrane protein